MEEWLSSKKYVIGSIMIGLLAVATLVFAIRWQNPAPITILPPAPTATRSPMSVYVSGAVVSPGIYSFSEGALVSDAIDQAGGPAANADLEHVNLAAELSDNAQVYIPHEGEFGSDVLLQNGTVGLVDPEAGLVNINTANLDELMSLPGIGEVYAQRIIDYREQNGPFEIIEDIMNVEGIGFTRFQYIQPYIIIGD